MRNYFFRLGFGFERVQDHRHIIINGNPLPFLFFVIGLMGFGITLLPNPYIVNGRGRRNDWSTPAVQRTLNNILKWTPNLKSLSSRSTLYNLDYSLLVRQKSMDALQVDGGVSKEVNLSRLKKLNMIAQGKAVQSFTGLNNLKNLQYVHVSSPKKRWLVGLPPSVEMIFTSGQIGTSFDLQHFPKLTRFAIGQMKSFDFATFVGVSSDLVELDITYVKSLQGLRRIAQLFPNLKKINIAGLSSEQVSQIEKETNEWIQIDIYS